MASNVRGHIQALRMGMTRARWEWSLPVELRRSLEVGPGMLRKQDRLPMYWYRPPGFTNFGDELSWLLVARITGLTPHWESPQHRCLVGAGSVIHHVVGSRVIAQGDRVLWGSGLIDSVAPRALDRALFLAVRGHRTLELLPRSAQRTVEALGDPGLLCSAAFPSTAATADSSEGSCPILIPHYVDMESPQVQRLALAIPGLRVIDPRSSPLDVISAIAGARYVISTGLHPLIVADSYEVPSIWVQMSDKVLGNGFKFRDYFSGTGTERTPIQVAGLISAGPQAQELASVGVSSRVLPGLQDDLLRTLEVAVRVVAQEG